MVVFYINYYCFDNFVFCCGMVYVCWFDNDGCYCMFINVEWEVVVYVLGFDYEGEGCMYEGNE